VPDHDPALSTLAAAVDELSTDTEAPLVAAEPAGGGSDRPAAAPERTAEDGVCDPAAGCSTDGRLRGVADSRRDPWPPLAGMKNERMGRAVGAGEVIRRRRRR
jgi:hypothetical protein